MKATNMIRGFFMPNDLSAENVQAHMRRIMEMKKNGVSEIDSVNQMLIRAGHRPLEIKKIIHAEKNEQPITDKIKQYARAEITHVLAGPASDADAAARLAICSACEHKKIDGEKMWCSKCGCGKNPRAEIKIKVTLAGAACPEKKWGAVAGTGASASSVASALGGVAGSIAHAIFGEKKQG